MALRPGIALVKGPARLCWSLSSRALSTSVPEEYLQKGLMADVHGTTHGKRQWRNRPLFRREGDKKFRNGEEAVQMLVEEAKRRDPYQTDYLQALEMVLNSLPTVFDRYPHYAWVMKNLMEPERVIQFRVPWLDDTGNRRVNRGYRVQYSSALGPYDGGLHFTFDMNHGMAKFLAFEHVLRNALPEHAAMGGAAGGSDFNPSGKSEAEIMRFCQSFMTELSNYVGPGLDIPHPGIGVGEREVGYLYGMYRRIKNRQTIGVHGIVGDGMEVYPGATGCGIAYIAEAALTYLRYFENDESFGRRGSVEDPGASSALEGQRCAVTGSGEVALALAAKLVDLGAKVLTLSDSSGWVHEPDGFSMDDIAAVRQIKSERGARVGAYIMRSTTARYHPWEEHEARIEDTPCDLFLPCDRHNTLDGDAIRKFAANGGIGVVEGAFMAATPEAVNLCRELGLFHIPAKAANSGQAALMVLDSQGVRLNAASAHDTLRECMYKTFDRINAAATEFNRRGDYLAGANISGFIRVADAMQRLGSV